jgi:hypothetical protein
LLSRDFSGIVPLPDDVSLTYFSGVNQCFAAPPSPQHSG